MSTPQISVILNTARSGYSMLGFPDVHHFRFTIDALSRQTFKNFELIISDYIHEARKDFDWNFNRNIGFPVYHVPITHSWFKDNRYAAICATKNNGIMFSEGQFLIFLDDCCTFESHFIQKMLQTYMSTNSFPNALHIKEFGSTNYRDSNGNLIRDCRYQILEQIKSDRLIDSFHLYGYMSCTLESALRLNGFDEQLDGSRQLEDINFGERLKIAGYHILIDKNLFVCEQEHSAIAKEPGNYHGLYPNQAINDEVEFKKNLRCNGPYFYMQRMRTDEDLIKANHRGMSKEEKNMIKPCFLKVDKNCRSSGVDCNWKDEDHETNPDAQIYYTNPPIFNLSDLRSQRLAIKNQYRKL